MRHLKREGGVVRGSFVLNQQTVEITEWINQDTYVSSEHVALLV